MGKQRQRLEEQNNSRTEAPGDDGRERPPQGNQDCARRGGRPCGNQGAGELRIVQALQRCLIFVQSLVLCGQS